MSIAPDLADGWEAGNDGTYVSVMGSVFQRRQMESIEMGMLTDERHVNLSGIVHGGVIMTLMDRVIGINCREVVGERIATGTLTVNFLRPVRVGDFLRLTCNLRKQGRKAIFADGDAWVGDKLVATATGICMTVA